MAGRIPDVAELYARVVLEVAGTNRPAQLALEGPFDGPAGPFYLASLVYRHLAASWPVFLEPVAFLAFFEDLARHRGGWAGEKRVASLDGDFALRCEYQRAFRPEVWLHARLATDAADPYWAAELRLVLCPESLEELAGRARSFFTKAAEPGVAPGPRRQAGSDG